MYHYVEPELEALYFFSDWNLRSGCVRCTPLRDELLENMLRSLVFFLLIVDATSIHVSNILCGM